jgi:hypothetical protein
VTSVVSVLDHARYRRRVENHCNTAVLRAAAEVKRLTCAAHLSSNSVL